MAFEWLLAAAADVVNGGNLALSAGELFGVDLLGLHVRKNPKDVHHADVVDLFPGVHHGDFKPSVAVGIDGLVLLHHRLTLGLGSRIEGIDAAAVENDVLDAFAGFGSGIKEADGDDVPRVRLHGKMIPCRRPALGDRPARDRRVEAGIVRGSGPRRDHRSAGRNRVEVAIALGTGQNRGAGGLDAQGGVDLGAGRDEHRIRGLRGLGNRLGAAD